MTRKRFIKLLMARGYERNEANDIAWEVVADGDRYARKYAEITMAVYMLNELPDFVAAYLTASKHYRRLCRV